MSYSLSSSVRWLLRRSAVATSGRSTDIAILGGFIVNSAAIKARTTVWYAEVFWCIHSYVGLPGCQEELYAIQWIVYLSWVRFYRPGKGKF